MGADLASPWQMSIRGLLMGRETPYRFASAPTGMGLPAIRTADTPFLAIDGSFAAGDTHDVRNVGASLFISGNSPAEAEMLAELLVGAWQASTVDLDFFIRVAGSRTSLLRGRPRRCEVDYTELKYGQARAAVLFTAMDPRKYNAEPTSVFLPLGTGVLTGATFDATFDLLFQPAGTPPPGVASVTNTGTATTFPTVTIIDAIATPSLQNLTTGKTLTLNLTMVAGDVLVVDMAKRSVRLNGASVLGAVATGSEFWSLAAGLNYVALRAPITTSGATGTMTYRSASI
jgi:Phage tail protein